MDPFGYSAVKCYIIALGPLRLLMARMMIHCCVETTIQVYRLHFITTRNVNMPVELVFKHIREKNRSDGL